MFSVAFVDRAMRKSSARLADDATFYSNKLSRKFIYGGGMIFYFPSRPGLNKTIFQVELTCRLAQTLKSCLKQETDDQQL